MRASLAITFVIAAATAAIDGSQSAARQELLPETDAASAIHAKRLQNAWSSRAQGTRRRVQKTTFDLVVPGWPLIDVVKSADAVVVARVVKRLGTRVIDLTPQLRRSDPGLILADPYLGAFTEYDVAPVDILKNYPLFAFTSPFRIATRGGVGRFGDITVDEDTGVPDLVEGRRYLLFLNFSDWIDGMLFDVYGAFDISGTTVSANEPLRTSRAGKELVGLPPQQALQDVRMMIASLEP